jgi:hypothetical protein
MWSFVIYPKPIQPLPFAQGSGGVHAVCCTAPNAYFVFSASPFDFKRDCTSLHSYTTNLTEVLKLPLDSPVHQIRCLKTLSAKMSYLTNEVNGSYGPGAWAAWAITLMASWIPILRKDYESNIHYISYALYTNWAAIDIFRQKPSTHALQPRSTEDPDKPVLVSRENIMAASFAVVGIGIVHAYLQYVVCLRQLREEEKLENGDTKTIRRRSHIILLGVTLPSIAWFVWSQRMCLGLLHNPVFGLSVVMLSLGFFSNVLLFTQITLITSSLMSGVCEGGVEFGRLSRKCYVIPCAPQSISEWDQAFALFLALFFLKYTSSVQWVSSWFGRRSTEI